MLAIFELSLRFFWKFDRCNWFRGCRGYAPAFCSVAIPHAETKKAHVKPTLQGCIGILFL